MIFRGRQPQPPRIYHHNKFHIFQGDLAPDSVNQNKKKKKKNKLGELVHGPAKPIDGGDAAPAAPCLSCRTGRASCHRTGRPPGLRFRKSFCETVECVRFG